MYPARHLSACFQLHSPLLLVSFALKGAYLASYISQISQPIDFWLDLAHGKCAQETGEQRVDGEKQGGYYPLSFLRCIIFGSNFVSYLPAFVK